MDTIVFQENWHISFLSLDEHFTSCYTKSDFPPSHTTNKMIPCGLSGSAVFYLVKSAVSE
jgi:hypothetical protein